MTIRLAVDGRGEHRRGMIDELIRKADGAIEITFHSGDVGADIVGPDLYRLKPSRNNQDRLIQQFKAKGIDLPLLASEDYRQIVATAVDQLYRFDPAFRYRSHNLRNLQDYLDYYHLLAEAFAGKLAATRTTHVLFLNVPHLGYDTILYQVARALGLKTLVLYQTLFPNFFFSMERVEDLGLADLSSTSAEPMLIEQGTSPDLFYMKPNWQEKGPRGRIGIKAVASLVKHLVLRDPLKLMNLAYISRTLGRISGIYKQLPDWRDPFANFFHDNELAYFENLAEYENDTVDWDADFIYAPLHNQPELSTSALGGVWRDQLLMIEALAHDLPPEWKIFVKENPRQGGYARGPLFFHRLKRIEGVHLLPSHANTHLLSAKARITATVTGTAGWEAIRKGRPTVVFGGAWYRSLPGVVEWRPGLDFKAISETTFPHHELERKAGELLSRAHAGVLETIYTEIVRDYDPVANAQVVADTLLNLLAGNTAVSFPRRDAAG